MLSWAKISGKALRLWAEAARKYPRLRDESAVVSATLPPASFTDPPERRLGALAPAAHVQARGPPSGRCACQRDPSGGVISRQPAGWLRSLRRSGTAPRSRSSGRATPDTHGATTMAQSYPTDSPRDRLPSSEQPRPRRRSNHGDDRIRRRHRRDADRLSDRRWL